MKPSPDDTDRLAAAILDRAGEARRFIVAIAGPPAAGKTTLAAALKDVLTGRGELAAIVGMDGFHYDNSLLEARGLLARKGAPETFDFDGFHVTLERIRKGDTDVAVPVFDRSMELSRAGAAVVTSDTRIILVEGNYLLLNETPWSKLEGLFDFSIYVDVPDAEIERRLHERWKHLPEGRLKVEQNDLPNAARVRRHRRPADLVLG